MMLLDGWGILETTLPTAGILPAWDEFAYLLSRIKERRFSSSYIASLIHARKAAGDDHAVKEISRAWAEVHFLENLLQKRLFSSAAFGAEAAVASLIQAKKAAGDDQALKEISKLIKRLRGIKSLVCAGLQKLGVPSSGATPFFLTEFLFPDPRCDAIHA